MEKWNKYKYHIYFWSFWGGLLLLQDGLSHYFSNSTKPLITWQYVYFFVLHMALVCGVTYGYAYLLKKFPYSKSQVQWFLSSFFVFIGVTLVFVFFRPTVDALLFSNKDAYKRSFQDYFPWLLRTTLVFMIVGFGYRILMDYIVEQQRRLLLEKTALSAELSALKNQINPHFLYNTLSYLYAQARPLSESLGEAILLLSDMMRYSLHETDERGLVVLEKEIEHIENYIQIHQLRFGNTLAVEFEVEGRYENKLILPLILISFVENAFKHGKTTDPQNPLVIKLTVHPDSSLSFFVKNRKTEGPKEHSSGIGLLNVKRRLALAYPNAHQVTITDTKYYFEVSLTIKKV